MSSNDSIIGRAWRAEPVAIVTVLGTVALAAIEAMTASEGWSWQTVVIAAIGALMGLVARQNVYAPDTVDKLASEGSKDALDAEPSTPEVEPHGSRDLE
jgi:hypothetical protein